jgi:hypothetical protein
MATLNSTIKLVSSDVSADESLNLTATDKLTVETPIAGLSQLSILHTAPTNLRATSDSVITYVYLKNIDTTNIITVKTDAAVAFADLGPEESMFFPLKGAVGLEVQANTATCKLEYAYWTKG